MVALLSACACTSANNLSKQRHEDLTIPSHEGSVLQKCTLITPPLPATLCILSIYHSTPGTRKWNIQRGQGSLREGRGEALGKIKGPPGMTRRCGKTRSKTEKKNGMPTPFSPHQTNRKLSKIQEDSNCAARYFSLRFYWESEVFPRRGSEKWSLLWCGALWRFAMRLMRNAHLGIDQDLFRRRKNRQRKVTVTGCFREYINPERTRG